MLLELGLVCGFRLGACRRPQFGCGFPFFSRLKLARGEWIELSFFFWLKFGPETLKSKVLSPKPRNDKAKSARGFEGCRVQGAGPLRANPKPPKRHTPKRV